MVAEVGELSAIERLTCSVLYVSMFALLAKSREIMLTVHPESTKIVHGFLLMNALNINLLSLSDILGIILLVFW